MTEAMRAANLRDHIFLEFTLRFDTVISDLGGNIRSLECGVFRFFIHLTHIRLTTLTLVVGFLWLHT